MESEVARLRRLTPEVNFPIVPTKLGPNHARRHGENQDRIDELDVQQPFARGILRIVCAHGARQSGRHLGQRDAEDELCLCVAEYE